MGAIIGFPALATLPCAIVLRDACGSAPDNTVLVVSANKYCLIVPRDAHTNIGDSETKGAMMAYCSHPTDPSQGTLAENFWSNVDFKSGHGKGNYFQLTGCIRVETLDRLNPSDQGGQYDSSSGGNGIPEGSTCPGYNHYVELIEPFAKRACIRCCNQPGDCVTTKDTSGCPAVIAGDYFDSGIVQKKLLKEDEAI